MLDHSSLKTIQIYTSALGRIIFKDIGIVPYSELNIYCTVVPSLSYTMHDNPT